MAHDAELLAEYARNKSEVAFTALVERNLPLVFSVALRQLNGDRALAEDVAQMVLTDLARKAASLSRHKSLAGWLYKSTRFAVAKVRRESQRRQAREHQSATMIEHSATAVAAESNWAEISSVLDDAMAAMASKDREALLLRFFQKNDLKAVGDALGVSEDAARMRINRALDKLQSLLRVRGITSSSLAIALSAHAVQAIPPAISSATASAVLAGCQAAQTSYGIFLIQLMASMKVKVAITSLIAAGVATHIFLQRHQVHRLTMEVDRLTMENGELQRSLAAQSAVQPASVAQSADPRVESSDELLRLRGMVAGLLRERDDLAAKLLAAGPVTPVKNATNDNALRSAWVQQMLQAPAAEKGKIAGNVRGMQVRRESGIEAAHSSFLDALHLTELNSLERSPSEFADFQTAFIQNLSRIDDPSTVEQIREIIRQACQQAVAEGLDIPSKPATDTESWVQRRYELNKNASRRVKDLLTTEQRLYFNRAMLGILGVDLGLGVDKSNYPPSFFGP